MILNKEKWLTEDKEAFLVFLKTKGNPQKVAWSKNILQTPSPVLAILPKKWSAFAKKS
jgi:hypothetical protein